jgi:CRP/FNR family transcriptional regulator
MLIHIKGSFRESLIVQCKISGFGNTRIGNKMRPAPMNCLTCSMFFKSSNFCIHLDGEELCELNKHSRPLELKRGEALSDSMLEAWPVLAISGGVLGIKHLLDDGRRTIAAFFMEGDIIDLRRRTNRIRGSLVALTKVEICRFSPKAFEEIIASNPDVRQIAWANMREQATRAMDHSADLGKKQALERLASFVFECQFRQADDKLPNQTVRIPIRRCDMAEYLGLQPETVSRGFSELQDRKIINFLNSTHIQITRLPSLKRIANGGQADGATVRQNGAGLKVLSFS